MGIKKAYDFAIIIPVYNNEGTIDLLMEKINEKVIKRNKNLLGKVVFCDDGSTDNSYKALRNVKDKYENIKIIKLTKNFGQTSAIYAGLNHSDAKCYIITSADLQDPIETINIFLTNFFNEGSNIIVGYRSSRDDGFISEILSSLTVWVVNRLNNYIFPKGFFDFVLISHLVKDLMLKKNNTNPFWQIEIIKTGFETKYIPYIRKPRAVGKSMWTVSKKIKYFLDAIMGYSYAPLRMMSLAGIIFSLLGILYAGYILIAKIYGYGEFIFSWAPLMIIILVMGGFQMLFLGIIGEYIWRIASQVNNTDKYVISEIIN